MPFVILRLYITALASFESLGLIGVCPQSFPLIFLLILPFIRVLLVFLIIL
jgi:hypothetical protein